MMAVVRVDTKLVNHLKGVFAPVLNIDERVVERRPVITDKMVPFAQDSGRHKNIRRDDFVKQTLKLPISERHPIQGFKLLPEV